MEYQIDHTTNTEYIKTTFKCNKCNLFNHLNINYHTTVDEFEKISSTFICHICIENENKYHHTVDQINRIISNNNASFSKVHNTVRKIHEKIENILYDINNTRVMDVSYLHTLEIEHQHLSHTLYLIKQDFEVELHNIMFVLDELSSDQKKLMDLPKSDQVIEHVDLDIFKKELSLIKNKTHDQQIKIKNIQQRNHALSNTLLIYEKKYKSDFDALNQKLDSIEMKHKDYKELKILKKNLILNDKEYKKFKVHIHELTKKLYILYGFIGMNIFVFFIFIFIFILP